MARELPAGECEHGYTLSQVEELVGDMERFGQWFETQTAALCEGRSFDYQTNAYVPACGGVAHGVVFYRRDVARYLRFRTGRVTSWD
jgi:hypothetical protein